ncbi:MAG TPA: hypothetical protein VH062_01945 [Polyangiaceae bacterium]|jgi:hypothetical protein|nr:hypothetical protein [Polyangiaceae bacterium]
MNKKWLLSKDIYGREHDPITRERDPESDPKHLAWIRSLPCAVLAHPLPGSTRCRFPVEAHHPTGAGLALRDGDAGAIPLCGKHHREELHLFAGSFLGWSKERIHEWERAMSDLYERLGVLRRELR